MGEVPRPGGTWARVRAGVPRTVLRARVRVTVRVRVRVRVKGRSGLPDEAHGATLLERRAWVGLG